jgi:hypothetical protein
MGLPLWFGLVLGAAVLGAWFNYNHRLAAIIRRHDGFRLGFATLNTAFYIYTLDRGHPKFPPELDAELSALSPHRWLLFAVLGVFLILIAAGAAVRFAA